MSSDLWTAIAIGLGMGFFLERAGFGSARKLIGQFYLFDMSVFKVMFTAIVTAMTGIFILSAAGYLKIEELAMTGTFVWPQIAGGLVLGAGFIIGGYCPGTSAVAAVTGRVDAMVYMAGILAGMLLFAVNYPRLEDFLNLTSMGKQTIYGYFGLPYWLVVLAVIAMAAGGFIGATLVEKKFTHVKPAE